METIVNGRVLQPGCRLNQYAEPLRIVVPFVKALARTDDLGIAAPVVVIARNPYRQNIFDNGNADGQSALQIAQISKCQVTVCLNILQVRRGRRNQNGARCRRTPEQGTLRTFENLARPQSVTKLPRACIYADVVGRGAEE